MITLGNVKDGETIHQRCIIIQGATSYQNENLAQKNNHVDENENDSYISVTTHDSSGKEIFPVQHWPFCQGHFRALLILNPGQNHITFESCQKYNGVEKGSKCSLTLNYIPLLQTPPLHLAILVAKDSALQVDCPTVKYGGISSVHSGLESVIAKFRLTAYMWQALTAEDLRSKGLGRRSFRLEEEWTADTLSKSYSVAHLGHVQRATMQSTAKIHLVRAEHTMAELRDAQKAQQNTSAANQNELHNIYSQALKKHGGVFENSARPVVAGLILDSHYSLEQNLILGHAALGAHNPDGLSLGIFGSHLTYSWPRYVEEIAECLLDTRPPGDLVGNDNGECLTMWEACSVGQGAFLHEVGHALSAPHTSGIMQRGYSPDWPLVFLSRSAYSASKQRNGIAPVTSSTIHDCRWDLRDALRFVNLPHFRLPGDKAPLSSATDGPHLTLEDDDEFSRINISSESGIAQIYFNQVVETNISILSPPISVSYTLNNLEERFDRSQPLQMEILSMNGRHRTVDIWSWFSRSSYVRVPGTNIRLSKQSVGQIPESHTRGDLWTWAAMLKKRGRNGGIVHARQIDIRVGCILDGAIIYYRDGSKVICGPRYDHDGGEFDMGGHQARKMALPRGDEIVKVQISGDENGSTLSGLRIHLASGKSMGALNKHTSATVHDLVPINGHKVIGFYGTSYRSGCCTEFGIVTAPRDVELPDSLWDLPELNNTDGGNPSNTNNKRSSRKRKRYESQTEESDVSEDEDGGYDEEWN